MVKRKGKRKRQTPSKKDVFLNIPFDDEYEPLLYAMVCSLACMGRVARCARETSATGQFRLQKIITLAKNCAFSIHDLSRMPGKRGIPRNNMPFELGLVYAINHMAKSKYEILILEGKKYETQKTLSDLNAHDPKAHRNNPGHMIEIVVDWFHSIPSSHTLPKPADVKRIYRLFMLDSLPSLRKQWGKEINFKVLVGTAHLLSVKEGVRPT